MDRFGYSEYSILLRVKRDTVYYIRYIRTDQEFGKKDPRYSDAALSGVESRYLMCSAILGISAYFDPFRGEWLKNKKNSKTLVYFKFQPPP